MDDKKAHILKTVGELFVKYGIKSVTMDTIASHMGISKKTLYLHFKDKEDLVSQVIDYYWLYHPNISDAKATDNPIDELFNLSSRIAGMLRRLSCNIEFELKRTYPRQYEKITTFKKKSIYNNTVANLQKGVKMGYYRADLEIDFIAKLIMGRYLYTLNPENQIFTEEELLSVNLFDRLNEYHLYAICTPKGIEYYKKQINKIYNE